MRLHILLAAAIGCSDGYVSQQSSAVALSCVDPARCDDSEAVHPTEVVPPGSPEFWRPGPSPTFEEIVQSVTDLDGDGVSALHDCDDLDPTRYPNAFDVMCDGIDQNCDGWDSCDRDGDGFVDNADCDPDDPTVTDQCRHAGPRQSLL